MIIIIIIIIIIIKAFLIIAISILLSRAVIQGAALSNVSTLLIRYLIT